MSHDWNVTAHSTGTIDPADQALALTARAAYLAAGHQPATTEDDALWTAMFSAVNGVIADVDSGNTADVQVRLGASGLHPGLSTGSVHLYAAIRQPSSASERHSWNTMLTDHPVSAEITLASDLLAADCLAHGHPITAQDTAVFDSLIEAATAILAVLDPSSTAVTVRINLSATVSAGDLSDVSFSLSVSMAQSAGDNGASPLIVVHKSSPSTSTVVALADIPGLAVPLLANSTYQFDYLIVFRSSATANGIGLAMNGPASPALISYTVQIPVGTDGAAAEWQGYGPTYDDTVLATTSPVANADLVARIFGVIRTGVAGGDLIPRFRSELATQSVTVQAGSCGILHKVA